VYNNNNPFGTKSLEYTGGSDPNNANYVKLSDALQQGDTERRKAQDAADQRERAAEIRREERLKKIKYMTDMPDDRPAGTGKSTILVRLVCLKINLLSPLSCRFRHCLACVELDDVPELAT
jgi:hypothetical protein